MSGILNFAIENPGPRSVAVSSSPRYIVAQCSSTVSTFRLAVWAFRALSHLRLAREVISFIARTPLYSEMVPQNPRFAFKFLTDDYLVRDLTTPQCAASFLHHYRRLRAMLPSYLLRQVLQEEVALHVFPGADERFALTMGLSRPYDNEGELTLRLRVDGDIVYVLSFTIVPGWVVESPAAETLLVTRLQGIKGCYRQIGVATRALHEVPPARLLLAALQGVAQAFHIHSISAIPADRQTSYKEQVACDFKESYDTLFAELGFSSRPGGFFYSPLPIAAKPITDIKRSHRLRAKKKRAFKSQVQAACARFLENAGVGSRNEL
jgi:uncharacterized protein VirK/YbjX